MRYRATGQRARCPHCSRVFAVRQDGEIRRHQPCGAAPEDVDTPDSLMLDELISGRLLRAAERCGVSVERALMDAISNYCSDVETTSSKQPRSSDKGGWSVPLAAAGRA